MRLKISESKNSKSLYIIKSFRKNGFSTTKIVEKLGTYEELLKKHQDPIAWGKQRAAELTRLEKEGTEPVSIAKYSPSKILQSNVQRSFNGGYLFLQHIYYKLGIHKICKEIQTRHKFEYDLDSILSRLIYSRILFPASKRATCELSKQFITAPAFDVHQMYRALDVIASESDFIQSELYKNSFSFGKRHTGVIYYDCTNYFFEMEQAEMNTLPQYGKSKENRPLPIVQMGLFMDSDGIPLSLCIYPGNTNEQVTLKPTEQKLISDFGMSKFVVCTDAGLASSANRRFNNIQNRAFITTQSIKKLKKEMKEWALDPTGFRIAGSTALITYDIRTIDADKHLETIFYKERLVDRGSFEENLIITYSLKYRNYHRRIRDEQIERAKKALSSGSIRTAKKNQNDFRRFIQKTATTKDGEIADKKSYCLDVTRIADEANYDGFYAVTTNLEDTPDEIIKVNKNRWQIEACFRIMKHEFKSRPVYLKTDNRIAAHFTTCFIALMLYRLVEKTLHSQYTCTEIIRTLREMNFLKLEGNGYIPTYTRTDITDLLHERFGFRTDYEILTEKQMKQILKNSKSKNITTT